MRQARRRPRPSGEPLLEAAPAAFYAVMAFAFVLGVVFVFVSINYETSQRPLSVLLDILRDLGVALFVTVVTATSIEMFVNARVRRQIEADVFQATFRKFLPEPIYLQVRDKVVGAGIIRREWTIDLRIVDPKAEPETYAELRARTPDPIYVVEGRMSYDVENLSSAAADVVLGGGIDLDTPFPELALPRFTSIVVGRDGEGVNEVPLDASRAALAGEDVDIGNNLRLRIDSGELMFQSVVRVPPRARGSADPDDRAQVQVRYRFRRALHVPGIIVLVTAMPADGFRVALTGGDGVSFAVSALHPSSEECRETSPGEWRLRKGILPWQGLIIRAAADSGVSRSHPVSH